MPPRKSNASVVSNGAEEGAESTTTTAAAKAPKDKDGLSIDDLSLPKSMIGRLAKGVLPANTQIQKDALLALHKSATVFVSYIASHSHENATSNGKKTIMPQDVFDALRDQEFAEFLPRLERELNKYNVTQCDKRNNYRRKVKEEKAAAAAKEAGEDGEATGDAEMGDDNAGAAEEGGHANGGSDVNDDGDSRPVKRLKDENGDVVAVPDENGGGGGGEWDSGVDEESYNRRLGSPVTDDSSSSQNNSEVSDEDMEEPDEERSGAEEIDVDHDAMVDDADKGEDDEDSEDSDG